MAQRAAPIERVCETCGATFWPAAVQVRIGRGRYCTHRCYTDALKAVRKPDVERQCSWCNGLYKVAAVRNPRPRRYCSPACREASKAAGRRPRASVEVACEACGTLFRVPNSRKAIGKGRWCSAACSQPTRSMSPVEVLHYFRVPADGCWGWDGPDDKAGYGIISRGQATLRAHRVAWEEKAGPIPDGQGVLHTCDNPPCTRNDDVGIYEVNGRLTLRVGHLFLGTSADNTADMVAKGRQAHGDTAGARVRIEAMPRGDNHPHRKLTAALVTQIRQEWQAGATQVALAQKYGVTQGAIHRVVWRRTWKHVP